MDWVPIVLVAWVLSSAPIAVVVGRAIHLAQQPAGRGAVGSLRSFPRVVGIRTTTSLSQAGSISGSPPSERGTIPWRRPRPYPRDGRPAHGGPR